MLQALIAYAEREKLTEADFETVGVRWLIPLDRFGKLGGGPIPLMENPDDKKPRPKSFTRPFTSPNELSPGTKSHFLCDTLERAVLYLDPKFPDNAEGRRVQHGYFQSMLEEASVACSDEKARLQSVLLFLRNPEAMKELHQHFATAKAKPSDNVLFQVDGINLLKSESLKTFWRNRRRRVSAGVKTREARICIATGEIGETLDTTEKIKGVPGGLAMGTNLISFDKDAFCSFGLEQAQNASLSAPAELKIRSALNQLIQTSRGQGLVFNNTVHLHWTRQPVEFDPMDLLSGADENGVKELIQSVRDGEQIHGLDANAYYATSLSGNGARIVVRDWLEATVQEVKNHVAKWFQDLSVIPLDGVGVKRDFKFYALLYGMVRADLEEISPQIPTQLLYAALRGTPLPQAALAAAIRRQQLDQENKLNPARIALMKACLNRPPHKKQNEPMNECLNSESTDPAYLCGRLFAVFDRLQYLALGGVNAGVVERYYASASVTPSLVMGRLFRNAQFHLAKAEKGISTNVAKDFEIVTCALGDKFPATLDLEGQGRFALGYYHQKADYRRRTAERKEQLAEKTA